MFENSDTLRIVAVLARLLPLASDYVKITRVDLRMVDYTPVITVHQSPFDWKGGLAAREDADQDRQQLTSAMVAELGALRTAEPDVLLIGGVRVEVKH